ncbi:NADP-dependent phosphogluconate dehydrogenase [Adhaeribacter pallidiroseus]|uniref:6-phosphogluconate dehydrogenase, decarboxylating n=1 Tax=Adhaeribacter pallidiroseus TaxID=2072847 RepID=A0A369QEV9_9BACT|nr:NADP-dependent phosphogluconate dehydrogenase [Adhaeribacter pallidiroseus]RDC62840.1 Phosphogluconate dehydrogenase (NADP(+)-dependent, decarboxylating) [Adhaeribacter pallidiroseus]
MDNTQYDFGMVGLGVMGRNLLLNIADHGFAVSGLDLDPVKALALENEADKGKPVKGTTNAEEFIQSLKLPRALMLLVPAGKPVDSAIASLLPYLASGDIVIDGGNSYFPDTDRRVVALAEKGIHFFGMGISGGEKGARFGPSMMPGGDRQAYERLRPIFEAVAAKVNGEPCVTFLGNGSAGNYVKMVHNGIEYGIMQLIAEIYDFMKRGLGLSDGALQQVFADWNQTEVQSFLIEITGEILKKLDEVTGQPLVNVISDRARQKGTGKWTSQNAMDLQVPLPTVDMAVTMRDLSAYKDERVLAAQQLGGITANNSGTEATEIINQLRSAFYFAMLVTYAQGFVQLRTASKAYNYELEMQEVAKIWRGGCIIRAACLEDIRQAFNTNSDLPNLLLDPNIGAALTQHQADVRAVVKLTVDKGIPMPALLTSLSYFDAYRSAVLPTNLIQAQRDYFGAHTYERIDQEGIFHTQWS